MSKRIADDFDAIAQRMQEIANERQQELHYDEQCHRCDDYGWVPRGSKWLVCPNCHNRFDRVMPR